MTKEEIIDNIARLNSETWRDREEVRTEIGKLIAELVKALERTTHGTCKDCKNNRKNPYARKHYTCELGNRCKLRDCDNFYCADFEK